MRSVHRYGQLTSGGREPSGRLQIEFGVREPPLKVLSRRPYNSVRGSMLGRGVCGAILLSPGTKEVGDPFIEF